jgi:uncharacterized PurR-regulated membrane protein YhhQ (DUF165 family)
MWAMPRKHKIPPIVWTILFFLVLGVATSYGKAADRVLIAISLIIRLVVAIVVFGMFWRYWHHRDTPSASENLLRRVRNWGLDR